MSASAPSPPPLRPSRPKVWSDEEFYQVKTWGPLKRRFWIVDQWLAASSTETEYVLGPLSYTSFGLATGERDGFELSLAIPLPRGRVVSLTIITGDRAEQERWWEEEQS